MNPHQLRRLFPNASPGVLAANAHDYATAKPLENHPDNPTSRPVAEQTIRDESMGQEARKTGYSASIFARIGVRVTSYRRRLIDPDNLCPKYFIDSCRYAGFIRDDSAQDIEFTARQEKVATKEEERTVIELRTLAPCPTNT